MATEKKGMTGPLVVGAVVFLLLWFVFGMSFFGSLVAAAAAGAIAHFAFGSKDGTEDDTMNRAAAAAAGAAATATAAARKTEDPVPVSDPEPAPEPETQVAEEPELVESSEPAPSPEPASEPKAEVEKPAPEAPGGSTLLAGEEELASRKGTWKYDTSGN